MGFLNGEISSWPGGGGGFDIRTLVLYTALLPLGFEHLDACITIYNSIKTEF